MSNIISSATSLWSFVNHPIDNTIGFLGSIFISIAGTVMDIAARIFEYILESTVTSFGATIQSYGILDGIQIVWAAFRDLSNIVIIGMFVFVAISMIIGNMTYGTRRWVANIIIVAVLINFSLLFTELVVDASQLVSTQFYRGVLAAANTDTQINPTDQTNTGNQRGSIADAFLSKMGVKTFWDSKALVAAVSASGGSSWTHSIVLALFFSLTVSTLLIATTVVFLYGAYLLIARALLLVVLLATSSLAFAAWLIPKYGESGWNSWRDALLQNAVLAPLLMIFLWASFIILKSAPTGSMGRFLSDPNNISSTDATATIVVYLFTIGMLYMSIRISSSFSSKITGFSIAGNIANFPVSFGGKLLLGRPAKAMLESKGIMGEVGAALSRMGDKTIDRPFTPTGIAQALAKYGARAGTQVLRTGKEASFGPGRIPKALDEKVANLGKRFGGDMGKGGAEADVKRAEEAAKKARDAYNKESESRMKVTDAEKKKLFDEAMANQPAVERQKYSENTDLLRKAYTVQEQTRKELEQLRKQEASRPDATGVTKDRIKKLDEKMLATQSNIDRARAKISDFEKIVQQEVEGTKNKDGVITKKGTIDRLREQREDLEFNRRFGTDIGAREAFRKWQGGQKKKGDLKALADAITEEGGKKEGSTKTSSTSTTPPSGGTSRGSTGGTPSVK